MRSECQKKKNKEEGVRQTRWRDLRCISMRAGPCNKQFLPLCIRHQTGISK